MTNANQCDVFCPRKAYTAAGYREDAEKGSPVKKLRLATAVGIIGLTQMARAAACPQRNVVEAEWQPQEAYASAVQEDLRERPLNVANLTGHEQKILDPYMKP